jgi:hypothetical protein
MNQTTPLTRTDCFEAAKRFALLGLDYSLVPLLSTSHAGAVWHSKCEMVAGPSDIGNIAIRGRRNVFGNLSAFAIRLEGIDPITWQPATESPAYTLLDSFGTLKIDAGTDVSFVFACDEFVLVNESAEPLYAHPLKGARLIVEQGVTAFGVLNDAYGRSVSIKCDGDEPLNVRELPALADALTKSGRFRMSNPGYRGSVMTGPPLL